MAFITAWLAEHFQRLGRSLSNDHLNLNRRRFPDGGCDYFFIDITKATDYGKEFSSDEGSGGSSY